MKLGFKNKFRLFSYRFKSYKSIMNEKYHANKYLESRSGVGSSIEVTETIREKLPALLKDLKINSMLDIPCGDFNWLKKVNLDFLTYIGADLVSGAIQHNKEKFSAKNRKFIKLDILIDELPKVDLIFCRDLLVHFSLNHIEKSINNIKKSNSKYLLTTSFPTKKENKDIITGRWRPINLEMPPFSFPKPVQIINENCQEGVEKNYDKSLCLWKISDL